MTDIEQLIPAAVAGDVVALQQLLLVKYTLLLAHIAARLPKDVQSVVGADDVLQQTFSDVYRDIQSCRATSEAAFFAWLKTIADHRLADTIKRLKRKKRGGDVQQAHDCGGSVGELVAALSDHGFTPSQIVAKGEAKQALEIALAGLPDDHRQALQLYYYEGRNVASVAEQLEKTPGAVRGILDRARQKLHEMMGAASKYLTVG